MFTMEKKLKPQWNTNSYHLEWLKLKQLITVSSDTAMEQKSLSYFY